MQKADPPTTRGSPRFHYAWAVLAAYLAMAVAGGALASRFGPRAVITTGLLVAALGMLLTGLAGSFAAAMGWRALTGIGSGASNVPVMALLSAWFAQRRRGLAAGVALLGALGALLLRHAGLAQAGK